MIGVKASVASEYISDALQAKLVPMVHGSPGIGKSAIVQDIAERYELEVIDLRLSQCDPTDLMGFPRVDENGKSDYAPMATFPLEDDDIPQGKQGWLLFLDEFNSAALAVQAAAYKLTLDRMIGRHKLHPNVAMVCAGNLETDGAIVNRMSTANQSRLVHMELVVDSKDWLEWAYTNGIDYRITSYIEYKPDSLQMFNPDHSDNTFACPRTWEFVSRLISNWDDIPQSKINLLAGTISEGVAREFTNFTKVFDSLPKVSAIESNPDKAKLPKDPGTLYAMTGVLSENINAKNADAFMTYVDRLPKEFQIISIRGISRRYPQIETHKLFIKKLGEVAQML